MVEESCAGFPSNYSEIMDDDDDTESSQSFWQYLDSMILRCRTAIRSEKKFLNEVCFQASSYKVIVGLSVARGMIPSVKIINSTLLNVPEEQTVISLSSADWYEFLEIISKIDDGVSETTTKTSQSENFTVSSDTFLDDRIIRLKCDNAAIFFCYNNINSIVSIKHLINYRLELLNKLQFRNFYDDTLKYASSLINIGERLDDVITNICNLNMCESSYYLLELLHYNPKQIYDDFDKLHMYADVE